MLEFFFPIYLLEFSEIHLKKYNYGTNQKINVKARLFDNICKKMSRLFAHFHNCAPFQYLLRAPALQLRYSENA